MINKFKRLTLLSTVVFIVGCAGGMSNNNGYGMNNGYGTNSAMGGGMEGAILSAIIQSMAASVMNGQIGSQLAPADENFRLQQLGQLMQSGAVNQSQQWVIPQTGNRISLNPIGQQTINPRNKQKCRNLEEILVFKSGKTIREKRLACFNPQTNRWNMVQ